MTREVVSVTLAHHFRDCVRLMDSHGVRHLPVVEGGRVLGVISVRDLLLHYKRYAQSVIPAEGTYSEPKTSQD